MNEIREKVVDKYPETSGWALSFYGPWTDPDRVKATVVKAIEDEIDGIDPDNSMQFEHPIFGSIPPVKITQRPLSRPISGWQFIPGQAGGLEISLIPLQAAIDAKADKLSAYRQNCTDARLLVCANSLEASGMVSVPPATSPNIRGFDAVYFCYFPHYVIEYPSGRVEQCSGHSPSSLDAALRQSEAWAQELKKSRTNGPD